ncbi:MAG: DUF2127 domain-containing protein [Myxococcales bacterium]|nr:DUF2127 domain-containing protein [Myxococcales bacterium]
MAQGTDTAREPDERAYRAVVAYKLGKAALEVAGAILLAALDLLGAAAHLHELALGLRGHVVNHLSALLVDLLARATSPRIVLFTGVALAIDGLLSGVEGWCLHRRYHWAPWVVVASSGLLIPPEVIELIKHPHLGRALLLALNLAVVVILARRAIRERRAHWPRIAPERRSSGSRPAG